MFGRKTSGWIGGKVLPVIVCLACSAMILGICYSEGYQEQEGKVLIEEYGPGNELTEIIQDSEGNWYTVPVNFVYLYGTTIGGGKFKKEIFVWSHEVTLDGRLHSTVDVTDGVDENEAKRIGATALSFAGYYASDNWASARVYRNYDDLYNMDAECSDALEGSYAVQLRVTDYGTPEYLQIASGKFMIREPSAKGCPTNIFVVYVDKANGMVKRIVFAARLRGIVDYDNVYVENCIGIQTTDSP